MDSSKTDQPTTFRVFISNNIMTCINLLTSDVSNQTLIPSTDVIQFTLTLKMTILRRLSKCQSLTTKILFRTMLKWT